MWTVLWKDLSPSSSSVNFVEQLCDSESSSHGANGLHLGGLVRQNERPLTDDHEILS
jgi:hypothetical protein